MSENTMSKEAYFQRALKNQPTAEIPYKDGQEQEEGRKKMQWSNEELLERGYINEEHYLYCLKYKINC